MVDRKGATRIAAVAVAALALAGCEAGGRATTQASTGAGSRPAATGEASSLHPSQLPTSRSSQRAGDALLTLQMVNKLKTIAGFSGNVNVINDSSTDCSTPSMQALTGANYEPGANGAPDEPTIIVANAKPGHQAVFGTDGNRRGTRLEAVTANGKVIEGNPGQPFTVEAANQIAIAVPQGGGIFTACAEDQGPIVPPSPTSAVARVTGGLENLRFSSDKIEVVTLTNNGQVVRRSAAYYGI